MISPLLKQVILLIVLISTLFGCSSSTSETEDVEGNQRATPSQRMLPEALQAALEAHGSLERWQQMKTMQYTLEQGEKTERHLVNLDNRKTLISHEDYTIGYDGKEVWVTPNKEAFGRSSARFYHNLNFYFFAIPFVLADPGINYEVLPNREIEGKTYDVVKITYDAGVGDAPKDYYIAHFDQATNQMYLLLYTVTYFNQEESDRYNALVYEEWQEVNGLVVPKLLQGYRYSDDKLGEPRYQKTFSDVKLTENAPKDALFEIPSGAEIDSLQVAR